MTARQGNLLGFAACAALLAYAYYAQFVPHLEPCPLCIFQRVVCSRWGSLFLIAAARSRSLGRRLYAALLALAALATIGGDSAFVCPEFAGRQHPACGASLDFMLKVFSLSEVLVKC
jgi:disulfide bond formation protein DsbB